MNREEMQERELELIDIICYGNKLRSMVEHPLYQELIDLQAELYPEEEK